MTLTLTVCNEVGCPNLTDGTRCEKHGGTKRRNGSTRAWRKVVAFVLKRDHYTCHYCGRRATAADHVLPRSRGGTDDPSNLVAACAECNREKGDQTASEFG